MKTTTQTPSESGGRGRRATRRSRWLVMVAAAAIPATGCDPADRLTNVTAVQSFSARGSAVSGEPEIFAPGVISDDRWQWRLTFTPNGKTAYFAVSDGFFPQTRQATIHLSHRRKDGTWTAPTVAPFAGVHSDMDPFITMNGRRLYFSSNRPVDGVPKADFDIWFVERTRKGWSEPIHAGPAVNSDLDELYASATAFGRLYFASGPIAPTPEADWNIYTARRAGRFFAPREPLDAINTDLPFDPNDPTADWEFNPEISKNGRALIFASLRPGGHGFGDLYVSCLRHGRWTAPLNVGPPVSTADDDFHPTLSRDGRTLYIARTVSAPAFAPSDFYSVPTAALDVDVRRCRHR
ncbi:MAG: TolB family protein [Longimicrobiales bacterium]